MQILLLFDFSTLLFQDVVFKKHYNDSPAVLISANHSTNGGNLNPAYNAISAWAEVRYICCLLAYRSVLGKNCSLGLE